MKYQKKLNRLQKELEKTRDIYSKKLKELKEEYQRDNSADALEYDLELNALAQEAWNEERWCQHSIDSYITAEYKKDAERLLLPVPATSDKDLWEEVDFDMRNPEFILSRKGIVHMQWIVISRQVGEQHDLGLAHLSALALENLPYLKLREEPSTRHQTSRSAS